VTSYSLVDVNDISREHAASILTVEEEAEKYGNGTDRESGGGARSPGLKFLQGTIMQSVGKRLRDYRLSHRLVQSVTWIQSLD
jgi:hypothetical protein